MVTTVRATCVDMQPGRMEDVRPHRSVQPGDGEGQLVVRVQEGLMLNNQLTYIRLPCV